MPVLCTGGAQQMLQWHSSLLPHELCPMVINEKSKGFHLSSQNNLGSAGGRITYEQHLFQNGTSSMHKVVRRHVAQTKTRCVRL